MFAANKMLALNKRIPVSLNPPAAANCTEEGHSFENIERCCIEANDRLTDGQRKYGKPTRTEE